MNHNIPVAASVYGLVTREIYFSLTWTGIVHERMSIVTNGSSNLGDKEGCWENKIGKRKH